MRWVFLAGFVYARNFHSRILHPYQGSKLKLRSREYTNNTVIEPASIVSKYIHAESHPHKGFYPIGLGNCVYRGGDTVPENDYHFSPGANQSTCIESCLHNANCIGFHSNANGCFQYLNSHHQLRAPEAGTLSDSSCWVRRTTYALMFPFHSLYSSELDFLGCFEVRNFGDADVLDMSELVTAPIASVDKCGVACASYFRGKFFINKEQCFCGDVSVIGASQDLANCGSVQNNFNPPRYPGTTNVYAQYHAAYPDLNEECPDGGHAVPSRFIKSGDWRPSAALPTLEAIGWTKVLFTPTGQSCMAACAGLCNQHGQGCHAYSCGTTKISDSEWFASVDEDKWADSDSQCYLALQAWPAARLSALSSWQPTQMICAQRPCLDATTCSLVDFYLVSGHVYRDSTDVIPLSARVENCEDCAQKCRNVGDACVLYQCSESLVAANSSVPGCLLFSSYKPDGSQAFSVSDVTLCRRFSSSDCPITDGFTAVGIEACKCGDATCLGSKYNVSMACHLDPKDPHLARGVCIELLSMCPEGEIRANGVKSCDCVARAECESDPDCAETTIEGCPEIGAHCSQQGTCPLSPLAAQCVRCESTGFMKTVATHCAADCLTKMETCAAWTIVSGPCESPNNCTKDTTATSDDIVCGTDDQQYRSRCDVENVPRVNVQHEGKCATYCTSLADTNCQCAGATCSALTYCSHPKSGHCVEMCDPNQPSDTNCICSFRGRNSRYTFCAGNANDADKLYCMSFSSCAGEEGCTQECNTLDLYSQIGSTCKCGDVFCCKDEICTGKSLSCLKACTTIGESNCACISDGNAVQCGVGEGASSSGLCHCQSFCTHSGDTDCLCGTSSSFSYCTNKDVCTITNGNGQCLPACTFYGQTNCACGDRTLLEFCDPDGAPPTYCTYLTILSYDSVLPAKKHVCAPKCEEGGGDCFCTNSNIADITPLCVTNYPDHQYCSMRTSPHCEVGCGDTQGKELSVACQCGHDESGMPVRCDGGYCVSLATRGNTRHAVCTLAATPTCGVRSGALVGLVALHYPCVCSSDAADRERICDRHTYCVAETGDCLTNHIVTCNQYGIVKDHSCYCCGVARYHIDHGGICGVGDTCLDPTKCKCHVPVRRCHSNLVRGCVCGREKQVCEGNNVCTLNMQQSRPNTTRCWNDAGSNCNLAFYGHCAPP